MDSDNNSDNDNDITSDVILQSNPIHTHLAHTNIVASPALSSTSDDDAFNTESAKLHIGALKSPERRFVVQQVSLFPPPQSSPLRRSPRLSSPRPPSINPQDTYSTEESDDLECVEEQLVNESDDEGMSGDSGQGTPRHETSPPDEPSSALADRITRALDNPSPPPSPSAVRSELDPHFVVPFDHEERASPRLESFQSIPSDSNQQLPLQTLPDDLISFDSSSATPTNGRVKLARNLLPSEPISSSFDDLLSPSPAVSLLAIPSATLNIPPLVVVDSDNIPTEDALMRSPGNPTSNDAEGSRGMDNLMLPPGDADVFEASTPTPLRRSARPRKSVTPQPSPRTNAESPLVPLPELAVPSPARTRRKKRTSIIIPEETVEDSQGEEDVRMLSPTQKETGAPGGGEQSPGKAPISFSRELGSLSPASTNLLTQLISSTDDPSSGTDTGNSAPHVMLSFSLFAPQSTPAPRTPSRFISPVRFASPVRGGSLQSPAKLRLQAPGPNDPTNTPARRIPVEEAIAQGHLSPQKAAHLGYKADVMPQTPVFGVPTPARRVLIADPVAASTPSVRTGARFGSPVRASSRGREASSQPNAGDDKQKAIVASSRLTKDAFGAKVNLAGPSTLGGRGAQLPFPLVPSISLSKPKEAERSVVLKPSLKHPTSRIPRMGVKPYARPAEVKVREHQANTIPTSMRTVDLSKPGESSTVSKRPVSSTAYVKPLDTTSVLKRKRGPESSSPVKPRTIMLRQVPQVVITKNPPTSNARVGASSKFNTTTTTSTDSKKPSTGVLRIRQVIDREPPTSSSESRAQSDPSPSATVSKSQSSVGPEDTNQEEAAPKICDELRHETLVDQDPRASQSPEPSLVEPLPPTTPSEVELVSGVRRTTRLRRSLQQTPATDIVSDGTTRTTQPRRKPAPRPVFRLDDAFAGMSATALKALTTSNTTRNQKYLAANLETEVIRREGVRPESPLVKVRTISQRQQEEKNEGRKERAARRARRSETDYIGSSDVEGESDGHSSPVEDRNSGSPLARHRRGAGDEEDYETPDYEKRQRLLLEAGEENLLDVSKRRVKWDQGLYTTVFLDEVKLGTRQPSKENRLVKGCLASTAKAARLDTLGNLPNADSPLADLVQQNITVKKFVYDNDDEPIQEVVVVKNTRSKSKKAKS